jgi:hypothetical protein
MTNNEKNRLKMALMNEVSRLIEFGITEEYQLDHIDPEEIRNQLSIWMLQLPGSAWNSSFNLNPKK